MTLGNTVSDACISGEPFGDRFNIGILEAKTITDNITWSGSGITL